MRFQLAAAAMLALVTVPVSAESDTPQGSKTGELHCPLSAPYDDGNPFARIISGEIPVSLVAENAKVMAIIPLQWEHPGHVLVIPKRRVRNLYDLSDGDMIAIMHMVKRIAVAQQRVLGSTGFTLLENNGRNQEVCQAHFHVIPNTPSDAARQVTRAEMDAMAKRLKSALPEN